MLLSPVLCDQLKVVRAIDIRSVAGSYPKGLLYVFTSLPLAILSMGPYMNTTTVPYLSPHSLLLTFTSLDPCNWL